MNNFNVKHTTNTNLMTETLTTKCVKPDTAISRFCRFLNDYDSSFKDSLLIAAMNVHQSEYVDGVLSYKAVTETDDYYLTLSECKGIWEVTIEFKHDKNTKHYRSISNPEFLEAEQPEAEEQSEEEQSEAEQTTSEQTEAETTKQSEPNKKYIVRAFENDKELTVQCPYFPKREYAIDYINNLYDNGAVSRDVVFTINNSDIYDCFSDVKMSGTTAQIKCATDMLNAFYKQLCEDIVFEYKMRVYDDETKDYYAHLNTFITILKKVLTGNHSRNVIRNKDKFEICGNVYRTAMIFILAYNENNSDWIVRYLENKIRRELKLQQ